MNVASDSREPLCRRRTLKNQQNPYVNLVSNNVIKVGLCGKELKIGLCLKEVVIQRKGGPLFGIRRCWCRHELYLQGWNGLLRPKESLNKNSMGSKLRQNLQVAEVFVLGTFAEAVFEYLYVK